MFLEKSVTSKLKTLSKTISNGQESPIDYHLTCTVRKFNDATPIFGISKHGLLDTKLAAKILKRGLTRSSCTTEVYPRLKISYEDLNATVKD